MCKFCLQHPLPLSLSVGSEDMEAALEEDRSSNVIQHCGPNPDQNFKAAIREHSTYKNSKFSLLRLRAAGGS